MLSGLTATCFIPNAFGTIGEYAVASVEVIIYKRKTVCCQWISILQKIQKIFKIPALRFIFILKILQWCAKMPH